MKILEMEQFQYECRANFVKKYREIFGEKINLEDTFIVWSCKVLQNFKCFVSVFGDHGVYVEYTYDGNRQELYEDFYIKKAIKLLDNYIN